MSTMTVEVKHESSLDDNLQHHSSEFDQSLVDDDDAAQIDQKPDIKLLFGNSYFNFGSNSSQQEQPQQFTLDLKSCCHLHAAAQYPCNADDMFECKLIDSVEKNQCIYNRCHPLHKMSDYKTHVWNQIAKEMNFSGTSIPGSKTGVIEGPGVELERKWRHMRDRYVRLRKLVKTSQPLKKNDKWFVYYQKMSFLDPYVEHRNRRKRGDLLNNVLNVTTEAQDAALDSLTERQDEEGSDSGEGEVDVDPLKGFYASFISQAVSASASNGGLIVEQSSPVLTSTIAPSCSSDSRGQTPAKKIKIERSDDDFDDSEVTLFVRSIEKTLKSMEPQTFALARMEISRVLYDTQFGKKTK